MKNSIVTETLSPEDVLAFKDILNALVFKEPRNVAVNKNTILDISQLIQNDFIDVFNLKYSKYRTKTNNIINSINLTTETLAGKWKTPDNKSKKVLKTKWKYFNLSEAKKDPKKYLESIIANFAVWIGGNVTNMHAKTGFTPKIMSQTNSEIGGLNCLGTNLLLGSFIKKLGLPMEFALTTEHPFMLVEIDNQKYIVDGIGGLHKAEGSFSFLLTHSIYYPTDREYPLYSIAYVGDFDKLVIYEILENFQALKEHLQGNTKALLPGYKEDANKTIQEYRELILKGNWRKIQHAWFSDINSYFEENSKIWTEEFIRVRKLRDVNYLDNKFAEECISILDKAKEASGIENSGIRDIPNQLSLFLQSAHPLLCYRDRLALIMKIITKQAEIPPTITGLQRNFLDNLREILCGEDVNHKTIFVLPIAEQLTLQPSFESIEIINCTF
ncbi:MAG TPA: hypothetical protein PK886_00340 [Candidatus Paceibacterota bacterium]|nr:hypothetical protein [Candidatus Paceibacterota bacterium]